MMLAAAINGIVLLGGGTCSRISAYVDPKEDFTMARSRKFLAAGAAGVAAVALIAASTSVTGAYFSDSHNGAINASTGAIKVNTDPADLALNFTKLLPGDFQTVPVTYQAVGTAAEDIWLVLPTDGTAIRFNGGSGTAGLGRYGHFAVASNAGSFTSFNLGSGTPSTDVPCATDGYGHGGSAAQAADKTDYSVAVCPVPNAILLGSNVAYGETQTAQITFGYTKLSRADDAQNAPLSQVAQFRIVATQHGILPTDTNNVPR